jgi:hypothetical protein
VSIVMVIAPPGEWSAGLPRPFGCDLLPAQAPPYPMISITRGKP